MNPSYLNQTTSHKAKSSGIEDNGLSWSRPWIITGLVLVLFGTVLRLWSYTTALPFRLDEIWLALNIAERSYSGLLEPLKYNQAAPLGFLFASKLAVDLAGEHELTYRFLPMLSSVAGLWIFGLIMRRYHCAVGSIIALAAVSLSPSLIKRAGDFKQYSSDFLTTSVMLLVALPWLTGSRTLGRWIALTCAGSLCLWFSHSGVICVGAVGLIWLMGLIAKRDKEGTIKFLATSSIWILVLATAYWFNMRHSAGNTQLQLHWFKLKGFMPTDSVLSSIRWVVSSFLVIPDALAFGLSRPLLAGLSILALVGQISLLMRKRTVGLAMLLIIIGPFVASMLQKFPFSWRLVIFLLPVFLFLLAEGVNRILVSPSWSRATLVAMCIMYILPVTAQRFEGPIGVGARFDMPGVIRYLDNHVSEDEHVIIIDHLRFPYIYYKPRLKPEFDATVMHLPIGKKLSPEVAGSNIMKIVHKTGPINGLWVVVPNHRDAGPGRYDRPVSIVKTALDNIGHVTDVVRFHNLTTYYITKIRKQ